MATGPPLLLLATVCVFVAAGNARAPRPGLAAGAGLAATSAAAADDAHAPPSPALATAPLATTGTEGLGWTPAYANGTAAGGEAAVLGRHRRGACAHAGHCCTRRFAFGGWSGVRMRGGGVQTPPRSLAATLSLRSCFAFCPLSVAKPHRKGGAAAARG